MIKFLKSTSFAITVAILSVVVQSFHSFTVFYGVSELKGNAWGIAQAVLFAVIVDLAILFYTVRGNLRVTWMFAFVMVLINAYYYYTHLGFSFAFVMGVLLSFVLPVSVYFYSEEIGDEDVSYAGHEELLKVENERDEWHNMADDLMGKVKSLTEEKVLHKFAISKLKEGIGVDLGSGESETVTMVRGADGKLIAVDEANKEHWDGSNSDLIKNPFITNEASKGFANLKSSIPRTDRPSK